MTPFADKLVAASVVFQAAFAEGVEALRENIDVFWQGKTQKVSMPGTEEAVFGFLCELPLFRKWVGDRQPKRLQVGSYSLKVDDYEFSYEVHRNDIKYDRFGILAPHFKSAGAAGRRFYDDLQRDMQENGETRTCFDGQFFYDTDHPEGLDGSGNTFRNLWSGGNARDLTADFIAEVYAYQTQIKDANGRRFGIRPNVIEYGPDLRAKATIALQADFLAKAVSAAAASESNVQIKGLLTPVENVNLAPGVWYLHDTRFMMPFLLMEETPPTGLEIRDNIMDPVVWDKNVFLYGARATATAGYGLPHLSARIHTS